METIDMFDMMLKFLDCAARETKETAIQKQSLDDKLIYHNHARKIEDARRTLMTLRFCFEDYCKNGKYEVPEIKTEIKTMKYISREI